MANEAPHRCGKGMPRDGRLSVSDVAAACGFCDQSHLTRDFTRMVGASPRAWRRALKEWRTEVVADYVSYTQPLAARTGEPRKVAVGTRISPRPPAQIPATTAPGALPHRASARPRA